MPLLRRAPLSPPNRRRTFALSTPLCTWEHLVRLSCLRPCNLLIAVFVLALVCPALGQRFAVPPFYSVAPAPAGVASGDFNGDGKLDVVTANPNGQNISVLLNSGKGSFLPAVNYTVTPGFDPYSVLVADLNRDGKLDIAVSGDGCCGGAVVVLLGNGDGTFQAAVSYAAGGQSAGSVVAADMNGDGKLDLIVPTQSTGGLTYAVVGVLLGNGDGTFQPVISTTLTSLGGSRASLVVADFNKDARQDVALLVEGQLNILIGKGNGTFQAPVAFGTGDLAALAVGDINKDGAVDIVAAYLTGSVYIFLGNADGTFQTPVASATSINASAITLTDLNKDGNLDVIIGGAYPSAVAVFFGNGTASLSAPVLYAVGAGPASPGATLAADLNGDGFPDVVCTNDLDSTITILFGSSTGALRASVVPPYPLGALVTGDFNNDGNLDVAASNEGANAFGVFLGQGDGTFRPPTNFAVGKTPYSITAADFNGDGKLDVATANASTVSVAFGNGDGTFKPPVNYGSSSNLGSPSTFITAVDVNGDGKPDLAVITRPVGIPALVAIMLNSGNGTFLPAAQYRVEGFPQSLTFADFNGDGKLDMAAFDYKAPYPVSIFLGNGDGTFQNPVNYTVRTSCLQLIAADLNGDGNQDLILSCGYLGTMLGDGDGTFQPVSFSPNLGALEIASGDFNGDGKIDIAAGGNDFGIFYGNGDATFDYTDYGLAVKSIAVGNFNNDNAPDVVIHNGAGLFVLLNTAGTSDVLTSSPNPSKVAQIVMFKSTLRATVKGSSTVMPTGSITFLDGTSKLANIALKNGVALYQTSKLTRGKHNITAAYSGDANFNPNVSAVIVQTVE